MSKLSPDSETLSLVLLAFSRMNKWEECVGLLENFKMDNQELGYHTYRLAVGACCRAGEWERACLFLLEMRDGGVEVSEEMRKMASNCVRGAGVSVDEACEAVGDEIRGFLSI